MRHCSLIITAHAVCISILADNAEDRQVVNDIANIIYTNFQIFIS